VPPRVPVVRATVGVGDGGDVTRSVEHRTEDGLARVAVAVDISATRVVRLDPPDAGEQRPVDVATRVFGGRPLGGTFVSLERGRRDAERTRDRLDGRPQLLDRRRLRQAAVHRYRRGRLTSRQRSGRGLLLFGNIEPPHRRVTDGEHGKHGQRTTQDRDRGLVSKPRPFIRACAAVSTHVRTLPPTTSGLSRHSLPQTPSTFHPFAQESNVVYAVKTNATPHNHLAAI